VPLTCFCNCNDTLLFAATQRTTKTAFKPNNYKEKFVEFAKQYIDEHFYAEDIALDDMEILEQAIQLV